MPHDYVCPTCHDCVTLAIIVRRMRQRTRPTSGRDPLPTAPVYCEARGAHCSQHSTSSQSKTCMTMPDDRILLLELIRAALPVDTLKLVLAHHVPLYSRVRQLRLELLSAGDPADAFRRSGQDQITLFQLHNGRNERDQIRDREDHIRRHAFLLRLAVDREMQADLGRVGELGLGDERAEG